MEEKKWLDLLLYTDLLNRSVKEAGWNYADKEKVYSLSRLCGADSAQSQA